MTRNRGETSRQLLGKEAAAKSIIQLVDAAGDVITASLHGIGEALLLVQRVNDDAMTFTGYSLFPHEAIARWRRDESFVPRAVKANGARPIGPPAFPLDDLRSALQSIASTYPVVLLYRELLDPDALWAGAIARVTEKTVTLDEISPKAEWIGSYRLRLADITRIDFGGPYENGLARVGKPRRRQKAKAKA